MSTLGLYLMTEKGLAVLDAALQSGVEIAHVTTAEARGMDDKADREIARIAKANGIPTFLRAHPPANLGSHSIAAGWRWMLEGVPNLVVLHDSLLPRYRGFSPLITALVNGEPQVGVTAFLALEGDDYDCGPIIGQRAVPVTYPARINDVIGRLAPCYGQLAAAACAALVAGEPLRYTAQDNSLATYSVWRDEDDYRIDWTQDDRSIVRLVGACSHPFPGAWTRIGIGEGNGWGTQVRITDTVVEHDVRFEQRHPGKVAFVRDGCPVVVCGSGMVRVLASSEPIPFRTRLT